MAGIRSIYYTMQRYNYLLRKLLASAGNTTVIYTKKHPIYTSIFEETGLDGFNPVLVNIKGRMNLLEKILFKKASIIHADSANMTDRELNKPIIVECEAAPYQSYFHNAEIKKILVESRNAQKGFESNDKVALCYPAISPHAIQKKEDDGYITLLSVGHGGYIKGYDVLYRVYKELAQKHKIKLVIAGSFGHNFEFYPEVSPASYERENFPRIYEELSRDENVTIKPFRRGELLETVYPRADIYVQFSRMETFGYSILEAMSFGLPIVSCHFKAIKEMVQHGENGYLVSSNGFDERTNDYIIDINHEDWANNCVKESVAYISALIEDKEKRAAFGKQSIQRIREEFDITQKKHFLETLYKSNIHT